MIRVRWMLVALLTASACGGSPTEPTTTDWIELDSISPAVGATLTAGERVTFTAVVTCTIVSAGSGMVSLVLQDHRQALLNGAGQPSESLRKGTTTVTLSDTVTVEAGVSTVVVFLPLFVDGITTTRMMKRLEYPVR